MFKAVGIQQVCDEREWTYTKSQRLSVETQNLKNKIVEVQPPRIQKSPYIYSAELYSAVLPLKQNTLYQAIRQCIEQGHVDSNLQVGRRKFMGESRFGAFTDSQFSLFGL